ncbi:uncharacterized protein MONBRDRAFT_11925 [Monosiga brevicollis MX1]|uniref:Uncharacterized protein n=1 Tax=Monosiga brevicollis TaxID=81824 RepID=A9VAP6_MONBE|nr:uncharacterized protein MONBRDRAFT_11925 [Monosiga brevicollis MX1]EDQ85410.1 predicted protein [Monosiga brevicollis MX1]|eukprot:XP_001749821.1 hypothetical protein [Monosiga brevicollis MX1]
MQPSPLPATPVDLDTTTDGTQDQPQTSFVQRLRRAASNTHAHKPQQQLPEYHPYQHRATVAAPATLEYGDFSQVLLEDEPSQTAASSEAKPKAKGSMVQAASSPRDQPQTGLGSLASGSNTKKGFPEWESIEPGQQIPDTPATQEDDDDDISGSVAASRHQPKTGPVSHPATMEESDDELAPLHKDANISGRAPNHSEHDDLDSLADL